MYECFLFIKKLSVPTMRAAVAKNTVSSHKEAILRRKAQCMTQCWTDKKHWIQRPMGKDVQEGLMCTHTGRVALEDK